MLLFAIVLGFFFFFMTLEVSKYDIFLVLDVFVWMEKGYEEYYVICRTKRRERMRCFCVIIWSSTVKRVKLN